MKKLIAILLVLFILISYGRAETEQYYLADCKRYKRDYTGSYYTFTYEIPEYCGFPYVILNNNIPFWETDGSDWVLDDSVDDEYVGSVYYYQPNSLLSEFTYIQNDDISNKERLDISSIKPAGWLYTKYSCVPGEYLYNRCHLIAHQLGGEDNIDNLFTGTQYLNIKGMLPFENKTAQYLKNNYLSSVFYNATLVYKEKDDILPIGVILQAGTHPPMMSNIGEDSLGEKFSFCVFCYNIQPLVKINYKTGNSSLDDSFFINEDKNIYIVNINTKTIHYPWCSSVSKIKETNKKEFNSSIEELINKGYFPCKICNPNL